LYGWENSIWTRQVLPLAIALVMQIYIN
jgi:hypothetical protein